ncbi:MAG: hypothetical protein LBL37_05555 [Gracilibacteraceae bacterium]|jgi:predicted DNA-binding protein YlxM (UPF0122 family)|nr:hypothetical protein [Gracilibacteraceae bacterium]
MKIARLAYLFDFYGSLLTRRQQDVWKSHYEEDLSPPEIAAQENMSRQAVHDLLRRTERRLRLYEEQLGLVARFTAEKEKLLELLALLGEAAAEDFAAEDAWMRHKRAQACAEDILADIMR